MTGRDDGYVREAIGAIKSQLTNLAERIEEHHQDAKEEGRKSEDKFVLIHKDLKTIGGQVEKLETDFLALAGSVDLMKGPVNQFVTLKERAAAWAAVIGTVSAVIWYFFQPVREVIVKKLWG